MLDFFHRAQKLWYCHPSLEKTCSSLPSLSNLAQTRYMTVFRACLRKTLKQTHSFVASSTQVILSSQFLSSSQQSWACRLFTLLPRHSFLPSKIDFIFSSVASSHPFTTWLISPSDFLNFQLDLGPSSILPSTSSISNLVLAILACGQCCRDCPCLSTKNFFQFGSFFLAWWCQWVTQSTKGKGWQRQYDPSEISLLLNPCRPKFSLL